jgi:hypothetical protein
MDGFTDAEIGGTSTQVPSHCIIDVGIRRIRIPCEKGRRLHHLARLTIAALRNLFCNPSALDHIQSACPRQSFDSCDSFVAYGLKRRLTGSHRFSI